MAHTAAEVEARTFTMVRRGFDPDEVRAFLREVASQLDPFAAVATQVADVLETAHRSADTYAASVRAEADAYAEATRAAADEYRRDTEARANEAAAATDAAAAERAAALEAEATRRREAVEAACAGLRARTEGELRAQVSAALDEAQRRLDRLVIAEREVADRLRAALDVVGTSAAMATLLDEARNTDLDEAFAEFLSDETAVEPSREWILSDSE